MNAAVFTCRAVPVVIILTALLAGGWMMQTATISEDVPEIVSRTPTHHEPKRLTSVKRAATTMRFASFAHYKATLLFRILSRSPQAIAGPDGRVLELQSPEALRAVVMERGLSAHWSVDDAAAVARLREMIKVAPGGQTPEMATLNVTSADKREALEIADALIATFKSRLESATAERSNRLLAPVQAQIKLKTEAVERTRNDLLEYMNTRAVVDWTFLERLNGKPGAIDPALDAALNPDIKIEWFRRQLETLQDPPDKSAAMYLAGAVLPFEHPVTSRCRIWQDSLARAIEEAGNGSPPASTGGDIFTVEYLEQQALAAARNYIDSLKAWLAQASRDLPPEDPGLAGDSEVPAEVRRKEYHKLKSRFDAQEDELKVVRDHAAVLFGSDTAIYVPPVVVLRRSVERMEE